MFYSVIGILAVIVLLAENADILLKWTAVSRRSVWKPYRTFVFSVLIYYIADILWGVFTRFGLVELIFIDTSVRFIAMVLCVMSWTKYVVTFFEDRPRVKKIIIYAGRLYAALVALLVAINIFTPVLFTVQHHGGFSSLPGRYAVYSIQAVTLLAISMVALVRFIRSRQKEHAALFFYSFFVFAFLIGQMLYPQHPLCSIAYMVGLCLIHSFVIKDERDLLGYEKERRLLARLRAYNSDMMALYTVDPETDAYTQYSFSDEYTSLGISENGIDFFEETANNTLRCIHPDDIPAFNALFTKEVVLGAVEIDGVFIMEYRLMIDDQSIYVRLKASEVEEDGKKIIVIGIEDIDAFIKREQRKAHELFVAKEMATKDSLTGVRNKYAFTQAKEELTEQIEDQKATEFAVVICDINGLKFANDSMGHQAGDDLIRNACARICDVFKHSSVFRIGGDEFAVICQGQDYKNADRLAQMMHALNRSDADIQVAFAMARYHKGDTVESVVERADHRMYKHKIALKTRGKSAFDAEIYESHKRYQFPEELKKAYESSPLSFVYYQNINDRAVPVLVTDGFCRNTGMPREIVMDWLFNGMFERMHPDDVGVVSQISDDFLHQRGGYDIVFRCRLDRSHADDLPTDEQYVYIHGTGKWQAMPDGTQLAVISYSNLSNTQESTKQTVDMYMKLRRDSFYTDPLTGLLNINYLHEFGNERLRTIAVEDKDPIVVYFDIFSMQSYNNQYGFKEGDNLLCLTANTLVEQFPTALVVRDSDDHFIMVTDSDSHEELEKQLKHANRTIRKKARGNTLGIRCGVFPVDRSIANITEAIDRARIALKRVESDMSRVVEFYTEASNQLYFQNKYIIENLRRAIKEERIKVYYQSIRRVESQKIAAFESLARWNDPERGNIGPDEFIPVLLKHHQLHKLDLYVFEQVCKEFRVRVDNHLPLVPVSINFSRQDFDHVDVLAEMNRLYDKYELANYVDKSYFIVEITEQDLEKEEEFFKEQLKSIKENNYRLWLDDFGSGYSSLSSFSQYQFDLIKIDMALLKHLDDNHSVNRILLEEMVRMAKKLGIHTLIEGAESQEQLDFIRDIGCELVQGYFFSKPESLDEILERVKLEGVVEPCETPEERDFFEKKWLE